MSTIGRVGAPHKTRRIRWGRHADRESGSRGYTKDGKTDVRGRQADNKECGGQRVYKKTEGHRGAGRGGEGGGGEERRIGWVKSENHSQSFGNNDVRN